MASIYQLVSTRAKTHTPSTPKRDSFNDSSHSIHYAPSFTGSETVSRSKFSGQLNSSVPSLATSLSSQSTVLSSLSSDQPAPSYDFSPISPKPPSVSSKLSFRSSSGSSINKSIQSLLRRRKQKAVDLNVSEPRTSLNIVTHELRDLKLPRAIPNSAMVPPVHFGLRHTEPCQPAVPFGSFPTNALESNGSEACQTPVSPTFDDGHISSESSQTAVFSGSLIISQDLPFTGTYPRQLVTKSISQHETSGSSGEDSEMEDMITNLRNIAATRMPAGPVAKQNSTPSESGSEDSEMEDMIANLQSIAATRKPIGPTAEEQFASLALGHTVPVLDYDQCSITCSESESESSFEDEVRHDELSDHFPLPSWPKLASTSQSPFTQQSLSNATYRPAECSVSLSIDNHR